MSTVAAAQVGEPEGGFLALMRYRNYALLWTGQLVSNVGDRMQWVAISLWVYAQTGSALSVSYAILALLIGPAIAGLYAGVLVDRLDRRKIMIAADLIRAVLVFAIPTLMSQGLIWVYLDLFLVSAASAFFRPAMFAAIPQSVSRNQLLQANAFFASMDTSTEVYGPVFAGLLVARFGYTSAVYLNAVSYLISLAFVSVLSFRHEKRGLRTASASEKIGVSQSIKEGLSYIRDDRVQMGLLAVLLGGHWLAGLNSLQTPLAKGVLGATDSQFGWFQSIWGIGFVSASLLLGWYGTHILRGRAIIFGYAFWAIATMAMGISVNYSMLVAAAFWVGFANMLAFVNVTTVLMEHTPSDKIGRVISTRQMALAAVRVVALLAFGWLADLTNVRMSILAMALLSFGGTLGAAAWFPVLWRYRTKPEPATMEAAADREKPLASTVPALLRRYLEVHTAPEFPVTEQGRLNAAMLLVIMVGWLGLLARQPTAALATVGAISLAMLVGSLVRGVGRRLRSDLKVRGLSNREGSR